MRTFAIISLMFFTACAFDRSGVLLGAADDAAASDASSDGSVVGDGAAPDADPAQPDAALADASIDASISPDATVCAPADVLTPDGCQPLPHIQCDVVQQSGMQMRLSGWITYGLQGVPGAATPVWIEYASDTDLASAVASCGSLETVPYIAGCTKQKIAWAGEPTPALPYDFVFQNVENVRFKIVYSDGTVRENDLDPTDGDPEGFTVGGSGSAYSCHIAVNGNGLHVVRIAPN